MLELPVPNSGRAAASPLQETVMKEEQLLFGSGVTGRHLCHCFAERLSRPAPGPEDGVPQGAGLGRPREASCLEAVEMQSVPCQDLLRILCCGIPPLGSRLSKDTWFGFEMIPY